uniref:Uncharacterized protein n=1 Tax=Aegilops tauschii subsp. strangulata TaxID=200361 RepID=A0A453P5F1_AEGTS
TATARGREYLKVSHSVLTSWIKSIVKFHDLVH